MIKVTKKMTRNTKNRILAISDAPAAMPPKPRTAATIAMTKKMAAHFNMMTSHSEPGIVWIGEHAVCARADTWNTPSLEIALMESRGCRCRRLLACLEGRGSQGHRTGR